MSQDSEKLNIFHTLIQNVLNITIRKSERSHTQPNSSDPPKLYIGHLYSRISGIKDTENKYLNVEDLDEVVRSVVFVNILHNKNVLVNLNEAYTRASNAIGKINKGEGLSQVIPNVDTKNANLITLKGDVVLVLETIQSHLVSNGSLLMVFPDYFNLTDILNESEIKRAYLKVSDEAVLSEMFLDFATSNHNCTFLQNLATGMWETDSNVADTSFSNIFNFLRFRLSMKTLKSNNANEVKFLTEVLFFKPLVNLFLENMTKIELETPMYKSCGVKRELLTTFGRLFGTTTLDEESYHVSKLLRLNSVYENCKVDRTSDFHGKKDLNHLKALFNSKRFESEHAMNLVLQMFKVVLKSDSAVRNKLLSVLGRFVSFNANRKKVYGLTHIDSPPVSTDSMYFHRLIMIPDNTFGFCINLTWLLLLLAQGITMAKSEEIDPCFCQTSLLAKEELKKLEEETKLDSEQLTEQVEKLSQIEVEMNHMLGFLSSASCMGDENEVKKSLKLLGAKAGDLYNTKFITQIYWLTLKGVNMLFLPSLQENLKVLTQTLNYANSSSNLGPNDDKLAEFISHVYVWRAALQHPSLLKALWHFIHISLSVFLRCFLLHDTEGRVREDYKKVYEGSKGKFSNVVDRYCEKVLDTDEAVPPPQFTVLPVDLVETVLDLVKNLTILRQYDQYIKPVDGDLLGEMDFELVVSACIFIMKCPNDVIKNISIKCDMACSTILYLCKFSDQSVSKFEGLHVCKSHLMDALVRTFISSQKSNYNTRISSRLNIIQSLTQFFVLASYKKSFVSVIISKRDLFVQFMHLLLNDTNFLIEEVVSYLTEIRRREVAGISLEEGSTQNESGSTSTNNNRDEEDEDTYIQEGAIDANQLKSMSGPELKNRTRTFVEYGFEICSLLNVLCSEFPSHITSSPVLLPQVATCLGCCLESLAGPKCLQLKVRNMDEYGFKPRQWLSKIMQCYISLYDNKHDGSSTTNHSKPDKDHGEAPQENLPETLDDGVYNEENPFVKAVVGDERYYKPEIFNRCIRFATREMFLNYRSIKAFKEFSDRLLEYAKLTSLLYDNTVNEEIPEHFLDPIMMDVMEDPVLLPTSGKIMDRKNIERHLMSESTDPFTRAPLERDQLVEQTELKREIQAFLKSLSRSSSIS